MSWLRTAPASNLTDLLASAPGAKEADHEMRRVLVEQLTPRRFSLIGIVVASCLGCEGFVDELRGPWQPSSAFQIAKDWRSAELSREEMAMLAYVEKGTNDEAAVRKRDVDELRSAGFSDRDVLAIATAIAYHNYAVRMAAAFGVVPK